MKIGSDQMHYVKKGWGSETWITNGELYCGKRLLLNQGKQCSFHYHAIKDEVIFVESGLVRFSFGVEDDIESAAIEVLGPGEALRLRPGVRHNFFGVEDSILFEFSTQHFDTDTIRVSTGD